MKKRLCSLLLILLLLPAAAPAEVVGREGMYGERYIHRIEAPNGQALYYLSKEEEAFVTYRDVNFDGTEDIVVPLLCMGWRKLYARRLGCRR